MSIDAIGDFLTIIRNGIMASKPFVVAPYSKMRAGIAQILKDEGFIKDFQIIEHDEHKKDIRIQFKYVRNESVIHKITRYSKPGLRVYKGVKEIEPVIGGLGVSILTTNRGLMTQKKAKELGVGGEVLCTVW